MIERLALGATLHPQGNFTQHKDFAAEDWRTDTPERPDGIVDPATGKRVMKWPIAVLYKGSSIPSIGFYFDGLFRYTNGTQGRVPERWAYFRLQPELWNGSQFTLPDGSIPQPAASVDPKQGVHIDMIAGQQLIDILKRSFTTTQIMDMMDASPYDEPDTGAPEGPL